MWRCRIPMGTGRFYFLPALTVVWPRGSFGQSKEGTRRDGGDAEMQAYKTYKRPYTSSHSSGAPTIHHENHGECARDCWSTKNERRILLIWTRPTVWLRAALADLHTWQWEKWVCVVVNHWDLGIVCCAAKTNAFLFENQSLYSLSKILSSD